MVQPSAALGAPRLDDPPPKPCPRQPGTALTLLRLAVRMCSLSSEARAWPGAQLGVAAMCSAVSIPAAGDLVVV